MRTLLMLSLIAAVAIAAAPTATAAEIDVGCGADTLEVCVPICIQGPCYPYVCVHPVDLCLRP